MHQRQCLSVISTVGFSTPDAALLTRMSSRSKCLPKLGEDLVDGIGNADAALDGDRAPAERANLRAQRFGFVGAVVVVGGDVAAASRKLERDGAPMPRAAPVTRAIFPVNAPGMSEFLQRYAVTGLVTSSRRRSGKTAILTRPTGSDIIAPSMRAVFPLRPSGLLPNARPPSSGTRRRSYQAMTTRSLYATWRRGEVVLKWGPCCWALRSRYRWCSTTCSSAFCCSSG